MPPYDDKTMDGAETLWGDIPRLQEENLKSAPRDFCALECLANDPLYAKPDSQKMFLLWEVKLSPQDGIIVETVPGGWVHHHWLYTLFLGRNIVRLPFNTGDARDNDSLSWNTIGSDLQIQGRLLRLPRWSTASRSSLALIPEDVRALEAIEPTDVELWERKKLKIVVPDKPLAEPAPHVPEWNARNEKRFHTVVTDVGAAVRQGGIAIETQKIKSGRNPAQGIGPDIPECRYRLYSVKTGVSFVGSMDESKAGKHRLETNSSLAMTRSGVIQSFALQDPTFGIQTEVLTITAPLDVEGEKDSPRDGFQVRDLSALKSGYAYIPGQAIPYARESFDELAAGQAAEQCEFWRNAFAVPLGRAKARLFLNFGLIHMSANAQNFLLGFQGKEVRQFVARDIGDTNWHDEYITRYFGSTFGKAVYNAFFDEFRTKHAHTLYYPDKGDYPPPRMLRLAAAQLLSHDFGKVLTNRHRWPVPLLYRFTAGILEGFRLYVEAALFDKQPLYPTAASVRLKDSLTKLEPTARTQRIADEYGRLKSYGEDGRFPPKPDKVKQYIVKVEEALRMEAEDAFKMADAVRQLGESLEDAEFNALGSDAITTLINAEELLLCAGLEVRMGMAKNVSRDVTITKKVEALLTHKTAWPPVVPHAAGVRK